MNDETGYTYCVGHAQPRAQAPAHEPERELVLIATHRAVRRRAKEYSRIAVPERVEGVAITVLVTKVSLSTTAGESAVSEGSAAKRKPS